MWLKPRSSYVINYLCISSYMTLHPIRHLNILIYEELIIHFCDTGSCKQLDSWDKINVFLKILGRMCLDLLTTSVREKVHDDDKSIFYSFSFQRSQVPGLHSPCSCFLWTPCTGVPETHIKRRATQHDCLLSLLGNGDKGIEIVYGGPRHDKPYEQSKELPL